MEQNKVLHLTGAINTRIEYELRDTDGNILLRKTGKNAETLWAKTHAPLPSGYELHFDVISSPIENILGEDYQEKVLTAIDSAQYLRSYIFSGQRFSYSSGVYQIQFSWANTTDKTVKLYGMISYTYPGSYLYTLYAFSRPVDVKPGYVFGGKYEIRITPSSGAPSVSNISVSGYDVNSNSYIVNLSQGVVVRDLRNYKYTRNQSKSHEYIGIDETDTVNSFVMLNSIQSSNSDAQTTDTFCTGELYYKCLVGGGPGGAKAVRYLRLYDTQGDFTSETKKFYLQLDNSWSYYGTHVLCSEAKQSDMRIYPWKFSFPLDPNNIADTHYYTHTVGPAMFPLTVLPGQSYAYWIGYLYWPDSPTLYLAFYYRYRYGDWFQGIYINGQKMNVSTVRDSNAVRILQVDCSSLTAGEGVVTVVVHTTPNNYSVRQFFMCGDFYGYAIPYVGFFEDESSEITDNWITSHFFYHTAQNGNVSLDAVYDEGADSIAQNASPVQGVPVDQLRDLVGSEYCYWVWVKESEFNRCAGTVGSGKIRKLFCALEYYYLDSHNHSACVSVPQIYGEEGNFVFLRTLGIRSGRDYTMSGAPQDAILSMLFSSTVDCDHYKIDFNSREFVLKDFKVFSCCLQEAFDGNVGNLRRHSINRVRDRMLFLRKQGEERYSRILPESVVDYSEGNATVVFGSTTYEVETIVDQTEHLNYLDLQFSSDTVFSQGEYFCMPICDGTTRLMTDKFENWHVDTVDNVQSTEVSPAPVVDALGVDRIASVDDLPADYVEFKDVRQLEANVPDTTFTPDKRCTHYFTYTVTIHSTPTGNLRDTLLSVLLVPKRFEQDGEVYFTNCESFVVTDGSRVIPHNILNGSKVFPLELTLEKQILEDYWLLGVNRYSLYELFMPGNNSYASPITVPLFVYVEAKKKDEILPLDVTLYTYYSKPFGRNDTHTRVYIIEGEDKSFNRYAYPVALDKHNVALDTADYNSMEFTGDSYISVEGLEVGTETKYKDFVLPIDHALHNWTIDFWFKPGTVPENESSTQILLDTRTKDSNSKLYGIALGFRENSCLQLVYQEGPTIDEQTMHDKHYTDDHVILQTPQLTVGEWHYIVLANNKGLLSLYVDGMVVGTCFIHWDYDIYNLVLGARYDKSACNFVGKIRWFHLSETLRWTGEHTPPPIDSDWDHVEEWGDVAVAEGDAVFKVVLPYALDNRLDVVDESNQHVDYAMLTSLYEDVEDGKVGNYFYIKCPEVKYSEGEEFVAYSQFPSQLYRYRLNVWASFTAANSLQRSVVQKASSTQHFGSAVGLSSYISSAWLLRNDLDTVDAQFVHSPYDVSPPFEPVLKQPKPQIYRFRIIEGTQANHTHAVNFFPIYVNPPSNLDDCQGLAVHDSDAVSDMYIYTQDTVYIVSLTETYNTYEVIARDAKLSSRITSVPPDTPSFKQCKVKIRFDTPGFFSTDETIPTVVHSSDRSGNSVAFTGYIEKVIGYRALLSSTTDYDYVLGAVPEDVETFNEVTPIYEFPAEDLPTQLSPSVDYLPITASDASRDIAIWKVSNAFQGKLITYCVRAFETLVPCYTNYLGIQPFVANSLTARYALFFTSFAKDVWQHNPHYPFTQDPDLVTLFNAGVLTFRDIYAGNIPDTTDLIVPPDTNYSSQTTNTVLFEMNLITNLYGIPQQIYANPGTRSTKSYTVWNNPAHLKTHYTSPDRRAFSTIFPIATYFWDDTWGVATRGNIDCTPYSRDFVVPELNSYSQFYWHDLDTLLTLHTVCVVDCRPRELAVNPTNRKTAGEVGHYGAYSDVRVLGIGNIMYNVLWDPDTHPVEKVRSFGHFTVVGVTDFGRINIYPVLKFHNPSTTETKYFMIDRVRFTPVEVPSSYVTEEKLQYFSFRRELEKVYAPATTFEPFDSLLSDFGTGWEFQYGWVITCDTYGEETSFLCVIRSINVMPSFTDTDEYHVVPYCYYNSKAALYNTDIQQITPSDYEVKIYNTAEQAQANVVVRLDLSEVDLSSYTQGVVAYLGATPLPTIYEYEEGYLGNDWNKFLQDGTRYIYVKVPSIEAKQIQTLTITNALNTYSPDDVFDRYFEFGNATDSSQWEMVREAYSYEGSVSDTDAGVGMTSTSDRLVGTPTLEYSLTDKETAVFSHNLLVFRYTQSFDSEKLYELGYSMDDGVFAAVFVGTAVDNLDSTQVQVPHYTYDDDSFAGTVAVRLPDLSAGYKLYVYYDTGNDSSSYDSTFRQSPVHWIDTCLVKHLKYWYETGDFNIGGNQYTQRLVIELAVDHPYSGDRIVLLPIVKLVGTKNFVVYRSKNAHDYFSDAKFILQLKDKFVAAKLPSEVTEELDKSKYAVCYGPYSGYLLSLEATFTPYGSYYRLNDTHSNPSGFYTGRIGLRSTNASSKSTIYTSYGWYAVRSVAPSLLTAVYMGYNDGDYIRLQYCTRNLQVHCEYYLYWHGDYHYFHYFDDWRIRDGNPYYIFYTMYEGAYWRYPTFISTTHVQTRPSVVSVQSAQRLQCVNYVDGRGMLFWYTLDSLGYKRCIATQPHADAWVQPAALHMLGRQMLSSRRNNEWGCTVNLGVKGKCTHMGYLHFKSTDRMNADIQLVKTHESDYIYPAPDLESPIAGFTTGTTGTLVRLQPTSSMTNWVVEEWERYYTDIKLDTVSGLFVHIAVSTGNLGSFRMKWFRISQKPIAPVVQLRKKDTYIVFPNIHSTWYAFLRNEDPVKSVDSITQHTAEVLSRNRSVAVPAVVDFMNATEHCRGIATCWLPPKYTLKLSSFYKEH